MADVASRDANDVPTLLGVSSVDGVTPVKVYINPTTHRTLVDLPSSGGTVTSVSVVTANGFAGTVATPTSTPAITLATTVTGILKGNGTAISAATVGTDYVTASSTNTFTNKTYDTAGTGNSFAINGTAISSVTGTNAVVLSSTPTLVTPILGAATATSINGLTITTSTGTFTLTNGKTLSVAKTLTLDGTDSTTMTFPTTSATIARTDAGQTFTGVQVMTSPSLTSPKVITSIVDTNSNILVNIGATASAVNYVKITNAATGTVGAIIAADGETNVDLQIAAKGTGKVHTTSGVYGNITTYTPNAGSTATLTLQSSNVHGVTMPAGNAVLATSNDVTGQIFAVRILQDSVGSRTVTWFNTIKWAGGSAPTLTTTANKADTFVFLTTSSGNYDGYVVGQNV